GSCVSFLGQEALGTRLEGFTLTGGRGTPHPSFLIAVGGGVRVINTQAARSEPTIKNCSIQACEAIAGAGVLAFGHVVLHLEDCVITNNSTLVTGMPGSLPTGLGDGTAGVLVDQGASADLLRCDIHSNVGAGLLLAATLAMAPPHHVKDCRIANHVLPTGTSPLAVSSGLHLEGGIVEGTVIENNATTGQGGALSGCGPVTLTNCVLRGNVAREGGAIAILGGRVDLINVTITANQATDPMSAVIHAWPQLSPQTALSAENSILWGNASPVLALGFMTSNFPPLAFLFSHCDLTGGFAGPSNLDVDPVFVAPASGDHRLKADSPVIDRGDAASPGLPPTDLDGNPRVIFGAPDLGAYEVTDIAADPVFDGTVGINAGGPFDVLFINGQSGGGDRRVVVPIGQPLSLDVALPPTHSGPSAPFIIFGVFAVPRYTDTFVLPFGVGPIAFLPCPIAPVFQPVLFTAADSYGVNICSPVAPSAPAPWSTGPLPGIPFPVRLSFQGVIDEVAGQARVTNGVILVVN
ncbi:MAG: right-handed parallel beta-helix repeat-containing protein, partial [Planctomycetes bacterium]|nr:right-handed parallel beta-helix repeat-containing protein [Planctomycetota bacterium]